MSTFVLVPGAWLGAWAWKDVVPELAASGHSALPITLTGMGDRVHLATPSVGMATAVEDVIRAVEYAELRDFVLVGHSFAGKVAAAVADRVPERIRRVIYLDSFRPERTREPQGGFDPAGEFGALPPGAFAFPLTREIVGRIGPDVTGAALDRMMRLATPWPAKLAQDPITLSARYDPVPEAYVLCTLSGDPVDEIVAGKWGKLVGPYRKIETGHWPMITRPKELAAQLVELAA
jgi:pimeloyl-ACP methyl ester carboxylesterase